MTAANNGLLFLIYFSGQPEFINCSH